MQDASADGQLTLAQTIKLDGAVLASPLVVRVITIVATENGNPAGPTVDAAGNLLVVSANGAAFPGDA